jgi:hypothetical protein
MAIFLVAPLAIPIKTVSEECCGMNSDVHEPLLKENTETPNAPLLIRDMEEGARSTEEGGASITPVSDHEEGKGKKNVTLHEDVVAKLNQQEEDAETLLVVGEGAVKRPKRRPRRGEDFKLRQALVKADFWILFLTFFCGVGTGVTAINNLGQIGEAQGYYNVNIFVSLISIANFLGRLGGGSLSEHYIRYWGLLWLLSNLFFHESYSCFTSSFQNTNVLSSSFYFLSRMIDLKSMLQKLLV